MPYVFNFPGMSAENVQRIHDLFKDRGFKSLDDETFEVLFLTVDKFEIIDLKKGIMYSWDGKAIDVKPA